MTAAATQFGPAVSAALRAPVTGKKRKKVLVAVAAYIDIGRADPTIRELASRSRIHRVAVVTAVDKLEAEGWIKVERRPREPNRYELICRGVKS